MSVTIRYLNTDLDLVSQRDLSPLATALEAQGVYPLHVTRGEDGLWYATFETADQYEVLETSVSAMLDAIESLGDDARELWSECSRREFNAGYDCGDEPWAFNDGLTNETLFRAAALGAALRITLYPPDRNGGQEGQDQHDAD
jgi:hypothetical protein